MLCIEIERMHRRPRAGLQAARHRRNSERMQHLFCVAVCGCAHSHVPLQTPFSVAVFPSARAAEGGGGEETGAGSQELQPWS